VERLFSVRTDPATADGGLTSSVVGRIAELQTEARLLGLGLQVARPSVDEDGYDLIVNCQMRVQVKSSKVQLIPAKTGAGRRLYRFHVFASPRRKWGADMFVFYGHGDIQENWWIVPGEVLRGENAKGAISLYPGARGLSERFEPYRDAWHLFR
jgi:hypothetical protein